MKLTIFGSLFLLCIASAAQAQECTALASVIGRETQRFGSDEQKSVAMRAQLCSARYESSTGEQRAQIEASYGLFSGGASGSTQQIHDLQEQQCQSQFGSYWSSRVTSSDLNTVSQVGAEVVRACLSNQSFRLVGLTLQEGGISAAFRFNGAGSTKISGIVTSGDASAGPDGIVSDCKALMLGKTYTDLAQVSGLDLPSGSTMTVTCNRKAQSDPAGGQRRYPGGIITVATDSESPRLPLLAYAVPPIGTDAALTINSRIDYLSNPPRFAYSGRGFAIPDAATLPIDLPNIIFEHGVTSDNTASRIVTIERPGLYDIFLDAHIDWTASGDPLINGYKGCTLWRSTAGNAFQQFLGAQSFDSECQFHDLVKLEKGDKLQVRVGQASGKNGSVSVKLFGHWVSD